MLIKDDQRMKAMKLRFGGYSTYRNSGASGETLKRAMDEEVTSFMGEKKAIMKRLRLQREEYRTARGNTRQRKKRLRGDSLV